MQYLFLFFIILAGTSQDFFIKRFKEAHPGHSSFDTNLRFTLVSSAIEFGGFMIIWALTSRENLFHLPTLAYAALFGFCFACATMTTLLAIAEGPLALTALLISYSVLVPTLWAIFFYGDQSYKNPLFLIGLALVLISLFLIRGKDNKKMTKKWAVYVILTFFINGGCYICETMHQRSYPGQYKTSFLAMSMVFVEILLLILLFFRRKKKCEYIPKSLVFNSGMNGLSNALSNFFMMTIIGAAMIPQPVLFPVVSAGQFVFIFLISFFIFHERYTKTQYVGYVFGALSVVLLNIVTNS